MSADQSVLAAPRRARDDSMDKRRGNVTRNAGGVEKTAKSKGHRGHSVWHLADVEARAFRPTQDPGRVRRLRSKMAILLTLILYERRTHPSGQAVCLLGLRRTRFCIVVTGVVVLVLAATAVSPYLGSALAATLIGLLSPGGMQAGRALGAEARLRRLTPPGAHVHVHSVASTLPGAGAELLRELAREADSKGWSLVLDTGNDKLAKYYENLGFVALRPAVQMPDGSSHLRMWRPAPAVDRGNYD
jgi:hypothetical protein